MTDLQSPPAGRARPFGDTNRWSGHWIAPEERPAPPGTTFLGGRSGGEPRFSRSIFRRTFALDEVPADASVRIAADSRYTLWINGHEVGLGPARSHPLRMRSDVYDIAPHLVAGDNAIAVVVTYYGEANSVWQPAPDQSNTDAALVLEARIGEQLVVTDATWKALRSPAWEVAAEEEGKLAGLPVDIYDARLLPAGWREAGFDDSGWGNAALLQARHFSGRGESRPPIWPFGRLPTREMSFLEGETVLPRTVLDASDRTVAEWASTNPIFRVRQVLAAPADAAVEPALPQTFAVAPGVARHVGFDFGRVVAGLVEVDLTAPSGTTVELHYRENPHAVDSGMPDPMTGARIICGDGDTRYVSLDISGLRFLHLVVHAASPGEVTLSRVAVRERLYPRRGTAYFRSEDPLLDRLYQAGVRTVQVNSFDAYTDCPTREQRAWTGDAIVHQLVDLTTNEDWGLARNFGELGLAARADGILNKVLVGDSATDGLTIPDWSLNWAHGVYMMYRYDGDLGRVLTLLPAFQRVLQWYEQHVDGHGTLADVPEWNLVDWASLLHGGRSAIITGMWARGLREFAELSERAGNAGNARWAQELHAAAAGGFEDFWDAERGLYVDHIDEVPGLAPSSQAANAVAIVSGLAPQERWSGIADQITDATRLVTRTVVDAALAATDEATAFAHLLGAFEPDWDVAREIVIAQPFFSYVVHDAVAQAGRADLLPDLLPRWETLLDGGYDTFRECWEWGTPAHGWSSTPARDLIAYVLGITPGEPGYAHARIAPRPGRLTELAGSAPTPYGPVEVRIAGGRVMIDSPVPVRFVPIDGDEVLLAAGTHDVPLASAG